jgi:hypothetical protein
MESENGYAPVDEEFDFDSVSLSTNFQNTHIIRQPTDTIPIRRPKNRVFFRTHPDMNDWWLDTRVLEFTDDTRENAVTETFLVAPQLWGLVGEKVTLERRLLAPYIVRSGEVLVWPLKLPQPGMRGSMWSESAMAIAMRAMAVWLRFEGNQTLQCYVKFEAEGDLGEPDWPPFRDRNALFNIAFRDHIIRDLNHPVLQRLPLQRHLGIDSE